MSEPLNQLIREQFADVSVDKRLSRKYSASDRAVPDYITDWLVSRYTEDGVVDETKINDFLSKHLPDKKLKNTLLNELRKGEILKILDGYFVQVDILKNKLKLQIPCFDFPKNATINDSLVEDHPLLLSGSVWGSGTLILRKGEDDSNEIFMTEFKPMQTSKVLLDYYIQARSHFTLRQWRELLVRSMGYEPEAYKNEEQSLLITRLCPLVQSSINLIELAPKGTGKSYIYSRLSRHAWLVSGGIVTRAQLFYNMSTKTSGVITRYDVVILDEVQTIKFAEEGEIVGALKGYLEQGEFRVMQFKGSSDAGFVLLANIPLTTESKPKDIDLLKSMPSWLGGQSATALLDRFHGLLPGWELRKINKECLCDGMALKADYFSEILHSLRLKPEYMQWVKDHTRSDGDLRDIRAVERFASAFLKLYFPNLDQVSMSEFAEYCLEPAKNLRLRIRQQLSLLDEEYSPKLASIEAHV